MFRKIKLSALTLTMLTLLASCSKEELVLQTDEFKVTQEENIEIKWLDEQAENASLSEATMETKNISMAGSRLNVSAQSYSEGYRIFVSNATPPFDWTFNTTHSGTSNLNPFTIYVGCNAGYLQIHGNTSSGPASGSLTLYPNSYCSGGGY